MKRLMILVILLLSISIVSMAQELPNSYDTNGIQISYPDGYLVGDEEAEGVTFFSETDFVGIVVLLGESARFNMDVPFETLDDLVAGIELVAPQYFE